MCQNLILPQNFKIKQSQNIILGKIAKGKTSVIEVCIVSVLCLLFPQPNDISIISALTHVTP